jgi:hypothetical protein
MTPEPFYSLYEARQMAEALRLIETWTTPGLVTPETVASAHEKARDVLGLID